jgi:hypothetical protein
MSNERPRILYTKRGKGEREWYSVIEGKERALIVDK